MHRFRCRKARPRQRLGLPAFATAVVLGHLLCGTVLLAPGCQGSAAWVAQQQAATVVACALVAACLWRAALSDAGRVLPGLLGPEAEDARYCRKCSCPKPPRTHHCGHCGRCIARLDHHCDWIDNCVGKYNHKYFILLLCYGSAACLHYFYLLYHYVYQPRAQLQPLLPPASAPQALVLVGVLGILTLCIAGLLLLCGSFCAVSLRHLVLNQTTLEAAFVPGLPFYSSVYGNIAEVMGPNALLWLVPCPAFTAPPLVEPLSHDESDFELG
ncbi:putative protein S-acyltransferase 16 [Diplonema papillatum]|nr:putative protein S-acyltransferase 16 [Diplonema papillatum]